MPLPSLLLLLPTPKRLLSHLTVRVQRGITAITMIILVIDVNTEIDTGTSTRHEIGRGIEVGSTRLSEVGMPAITMMELDMTRRATRGDFGGPEKG